MQAQPSSVASYHACDATGGHGLDVLARCYSILAGTAIGEHITKYNAQEIGNILWADAGLGYANVPLLDAISSAARATLHSAAPMTIANTLWAIASLCRSFDRPLLHAIASSSRARCSDFGPIDLAQSAWAVAHLEYSPQPLRDSLASSAIALLESCADYRVQSLSNPAWSFAT